MEEYPKSVTKQCHKKILDQMNDSIFVIKRENGKIEIGLFCYIKYENKKIPCILMNNYITNDEYKNIINILKNKNGIESVDMIYRDKYYNISIIKIKENNINNNKYISIDDDIYKNETEIYYNKASIYIIKCNNIKDISVSYGVIKEINKKELIYTGNINSNNKFSPIFNLSNNKLIGININNSHYYNRGLFLKNTEIIKEYKELKKIKKIENNHGYYKNNKNEINILINIEENDIDKEIYFLDNYEYKDKEGIIHYHDNLNELNELNTELYIENIKYKYQKYFKPKKIGINKIKLIINDNIIDCSYMFAGCDKIIDINFNNFNTKDVINMKYLFYECKNIKKLYLYSFDTKNVTNMSNMFIH